MIKPEKLDQALHALKSILAQLRTCALRAEDAKKIATVLDIMEKLPRFLASAKDATVDFDRPLSDIADRFPEFGIGLSLFLEERPSSFW